MKCTESISGRKNTCRDLLGKRSCQEGSMNNTMKNKQKYTLTLERNCPWLGVHFKVKVLYSTRHTFINRCYNKGVDRDILKSIVGHEPDFTMDVYGGNPFTPKQLYNEISKVSYSKIRWNRLEVDWKKILGWGSFDNKNKQLYYPQTPSVLF